MPYGRDGVDASLPSFRRRRRAVCARSAAKLDRWAYWLWKLKGFLSTQLLESLLWGLGHVDLYNRACDESKLYVKKILAILYLSWNARSSFMQIEINEESRKTYLTMPTVVNSILVASFLELLHCFLSSWVLMSSNDILPPMFHILVLQFQAWTECSVVLMKTLLLYRAKALSHARTIFAAKLMEELARLGWERALICIQGNRKEESYAEQALHCAMPNLGCSLS